jgi:hypothetical protein
MNARYCLSLVAAAASAQAVLAQEGVTFSWSWTEVVAGTTSPVLSPNFVLEPGEAARIRLTASFSPAVGSPASHLGFSGTVAGLSNIFFDLIGHGAAEGTWSNHRRAPLWSGLNGIPSLDGRNLMANGVFQFPPPGMTPNTANPVIDLWSAVWTPAIYHGPWVYTAFHAQRAEAAGPGSTGGQLLINIGGPNYEYISKPVPVSFGGVVIVIPAPASFAVLLGMGAVMARRRR